MSARKIQSEMQFVVLVGDIPITPRIEGIINSYKIMGAHITYSSEISYSEFGTMCHIDTKENIQNRIATIKDINIRYIGYVNGTDEILSSKCNGYVGIPVITDVEEIPHGMWCVSYPHITLVPPSGSNKFNENIELIGQPIEFDMSELIKTQNTYSHSVILSGEEHHVTRLVLDGQKPFIAKKEMTGIRGDKYIHYIGFPVIM